MNFILAIIGAMVIGSFVHVQKRLDMILGRLDEIENNLENTRKDILNEFEQNNRL